MILERLYSLRSQAPDTISMGNNLVLKKSDFGVIAKLLRLIKPLKTMQDRGVLYDVYLDEKNIGYIQIHEESREELNIPWLMVDKKYRGQGIATRMMKQIITFAAKSGYKKITLEVPGNSPDARHIYEKLGFVVTHEDQDKDNIWGGLTDMELKL